ncbi:hypothetical protein G6L28_09965 [Agrobacterium larrymoorei]|uniref:hypothetical protein n=1 Tax=Agrobacterium larrymoorei TaxID=160699 RepID=UPI0015743EEF|nr:hypothetical protein [Agrobacterium larrymoorei]NTJ42918.1 hypothetical protein [Agrobacterium larrymoorei]
MVVFIAHRTDGFGARVYNMMITMMLAEAYGGDFRFTWRDTSKEFHALDSAEEVFEKDFLVKHLASEQELKHITASSYVIEPETQLNQALLEEVLSAGPQFIIVSRLDEPQELCCLPGYDENAVAKMFERIGFNSDLKKIVSSAREVDLPLRPAAVHLRSGDIVFGHYRLDIGFESKVIPLPLARVIILDLKRDGHSPVIFGQDQTTCNFLAEITDCRTVEQVADMSDMTVLERAVFEIVVLSRMEIIHAGMSLFAYVPAAIGTVPIHDPLRIYTPQDIASLTMDGLQTFESSSLVSPLQIAFCYRIALHFAEGFQSDWKLAAVDGAIRNDPENVLYIFIMAQLLFEAGRNYEGDRVLASALSKNGIMVARTSAFRFLSNRYPGGNLKAEPWLQALENRTLLESPFACLSVSIAAMRVLAYGKSLKYAVRAARLSPMQPSIIGQLINLIWACISGKWISRLRSVDWLSNQQWLKKIGIERAPMRRET